MTSVSVVLVTVPVDEADSLVDRLLAAKLIACANMIGPIRSRYRWEGAIETSTEMLLLLKTSTARVEELCERVSEWHSYDVPEVLALAADTGLEAYTAWVGSECSIDSGDSRG